MTNRWRVVARVRQHVRMTSRLVLISGGMLVVGLTIHADSGWAAMRDRDEVPVQLGLKPA